MSAETVPDAASEPAWSWRADWTTPIRRHAVPVALAALAVETVVVLRLGLRADLVAFVLLGLTGTLLGCVDVALKRLPDPLTLPSYPLGIGLLGAAAPFMSDGGERFVGALLGMAALWVLFAVQWFLLPKAMGFGDVKLSGVLGLHLGWLGMDAWMLGTFAMFIVGGLYAMALLVLRRAKRGESMPFGPFMLAGALIGILMHA